MSDNTKNQNNPNPKPTLTTQSQMDEIFIKSLEKYSAIIGNANIVIKDIKSMKKVFNSSLLSLFLVIALLVILYTIRELNTPAINETINGIIAIMITVFHVLLVVSVIIINMFLNEKYNKHFIRKLNKIFN